MKLACCLHIKVQQPGERQVNLADLLHVQGIAKAAQPESYFHRYATLSDDEAESTARDIWKRINEPNLEENVLPTRGRAQLVLTKEADHSIRRMLLRKV